MNRLFELLGLRPLERGCLFAAKSLLAGQTVDEVYANLRKMNYSDHSAARIVAFLPSAFARVWYADAGYRFPSYFYPGRNAFEKGQIRRYDDESIYTMALQLAQQLVRDGDADEVRRIIEISAEHRVIVAAKSQNLKFQEISAVMHEF